MKEAYELISNAVAHSYGVYYNTIDEFTACVNTINYNRAYFNPPVGNWLPVDKKAKVSVDFNIGYGDNPVIATTIFEEGDTYRYSPVSNPSEPRAGYTFEGWYTYPDGQGTQINADTVLSNMVDHTLYAYWVSDDADESLDNGFSTAGLFALTTSEYAVETDIDQIVYDLMGVGYRVAEWDDLVNFHAEGGDLTALLDELGVAWGDFAFVKRNGNRQHSSNRYYYVSRHNHNMPDTYTYLVHDNIDDHLVSLGSWNSDLKILAIKIEEHVSDYKVGNRGPSGGYIFYDKGLDSDGWRYLEAAPYGWYTGENEFGGAYGGEYDPWIQWGLDCSWVIMHSDNYGFMELLDSPATAEEIGTGASNTENIVNGLSLF